MRVFSFGGGVQSTAVLVLAAQGEIGYDAFLFANVGEDSENPDTLRYVAEIARPYAEQHGLRFEELRRRRRNGTVETVLGRIRHRRRSLVIPVRFDAGDGKRGRARRSCTANFKVELVARWLRDHGATPEAPATTGLGISTDEFHRARTDSGIAWQRLEYPLLDRRLSRRDCHRIIADAGLPDPPKSSCWFCPFKAYGDWRRLKTERPDLFGRAVEIERLLDERGANWDMRPVRLSNSTLPLDRLIAGDQLTLDDAMDSCESGYCWT